MYSEYDLNKIFEYVFGTLFFVSLRVFILNAFKKYFTQVWLLLYTIKTCNYIVFAGITDVSQDGPWTAAREPGTAGPIKYVIFAVAAHFARIFVGCGEWKILPCTSYTRTTEMSTHCRYEYNLCVRFYFRLSPQHQCDII